MRTYIKQHSEGISQAIGIIAWVTVVLYLLDSDAKILDDIEVFIVFMLVSLGYFNWLGVFYPDKDKNGFIIQDKN